MNAGTPRSAPLLGRDAFAPSYAHARARVRAAAAALDARVSSFPISERGPAGEELSLDAIRIGAPNAGRVVVVSSGVHGVEGFLGSAVQHVLLRTLLPALGWDEDPAVVLLHAVNPYGFAWLRRVNEHNVDLNRNFPTVRQDYAGCPRAYRRVDDLINPRSPPRHDLFYPRVAGRVIRYGFDALKDAVVAGQYERSQGLFYGGTRPNAAVEILNRALPELIGPAEQVLHVDIHSGLGRWGAFRLLLDDEDAASGSEGWRRFAAGFPGTVVEAVNGRGNDCQVTGSLGEWCRERFRDRLYDVVCAEFGTYPALRVLAALRDENRAHHWGQADAERSRRATRRLVEMFAPRAPAWRDKAVRAGVAIVERAIAALRARTVH